MAGVRVSAGQKSRLCKEADSVITIKSMGNVADQLTLPAIEMY